MVENGETLYDMLTESLEDALQAREEGRILKKDILIRDRLLKYGGLQLHYSVEVAADEALDCYEGLKKEGE